MLPVSALKIGDPVTISVDMVADDLSLHVNITAVEGEGAEGAGIISAWHICALRAVASQPSQQRRSAPCGLVYPTSTRALRIIAQSASASEHKNSSSAQAMRSESSSSLIWHPRLGRGGLAALPVFLGVVLGDGQPSHLLNELLECRSWIELPAASASLLHVRDQSPLRAGVAIDVAFGSLDGTMPREQLHVAQAAARAMNVAGGDGDEAAPAGVRQILHTAESMFHYHGPANTHGLASCWIFRARPGWLRATMHPDEMPKYDFRFNSMAGLVSDQDLLRAEPPDYLLRALSRRKASRINDRTPPSI